MGRWGVRFPVEIAVPDLPLRVAISTGKRTPHPPCPTSGVLGARGGSRAKGARAWGARRNPTLGLEKRFRPENDRECTPRGVHSRSFSGRNRFSNPSVGFRRAPQARAPFAREPPRAPKTPEVGQGGWGVRFPVEIATLRGRSGTAISTGKRTPHRPIPTLGVSGARGGPRAKASPAWRARRNPTVG